MRPIAPGFLLLALLAAAPLAGAHGGGGSASGDSLPQARVLGAPPARAFDELEPGAPHYYRVVTTEASTMRVVAPWGAPPPGTVFVYALGPDLPLETRTPAEVERPEGWGALAFVAGDGGELAHAGLPARLHLLLARDIGAGERVIVVLGDSAARVAVIVEEPGFAWRDVALLPSDRADARAWAGVPTWMAWATGGLGGLLALARVLRWRGGAWPLASLLGAFAAVALAASAALLLLDAWRARFAPWLLLLAAAASLALALWGSRPRGRPTWRARTALLASALVGLAAGAGFLWGPLAALAGALLPEPAAGEGSAGQPARRL